MPYPHPEDISHFLTCLTTTPQESYPYRHWMLSNLFKEEVIDDLISVPFQTHELTYDVGSREEHNSTRQYINPLSMSQHPICHRVGEIFKNREVISQFEHMGGINLKDSLLRIEYTVDTKGFWLKPHTDIGVKLFTMLIYLSKDPHAIGWGTDIYESAEKHVRAVPFKSNTALMFIPSHNTWHGFEPRELNGVRKTLIVNYVTQEWRNRHELVHPTDSVYY
jgi:hypothetical protein